MGFMRKRQRSVPAPSIAVGSYFQLHSSLDYRETESMSIQMSLIFGTLVVQMGVLVVLLLPLPHSIRLRIVDITWVLQQNNNFRVVVTFTSLLLGLQFMDCVRRLHKFNNSGNPYFTGYLNISGSLTHEQLATKFYSQRNLYLTGAVLYMGLSIATVVSILRKLSKKEGDFRGLAKPAAVEDKAEVEKYEALIKQRESDIAALKKQVLGLQRAYDELTPASNADKKSD